MKTLIKVCGITSAEDALLAANLGADFVGLIFAESSPRRVTPERAADIVRVLRTMKGAKPWTIGVFQDESPDKILEILKAARIDCAQLHGTESPSVCNGLTVPTIKTVTYRPGMDPADLIQTLRAYHPAVNPMIRFVLLDLPKGEKFSVEDQQKFLQPLYDKILKDVPHFLAGGLTPKTVGDFVQRFRPNGVDVASGVEKGPGVKDRDKLHAFCDAVRSGHEVPA